MASTLITTGRATTHAPVTPSRWIQAQRVMRAAWAIVRASGATLREALRAAWATEKAVQTPEGSGPTHTQADRRAVLTLMPVMAVLPGAVLPPPADMSLPRLGTMLRIAWDLEIHAYQHGASRAEIDWAEAACSALVGRIEALPARTLADLSVKALALSWCRSGEPFVADAYNPDQPATDLRLADAIVSDLLATGRLH